MSSPFIGEIRIFAGTFAPEGWLACEGQRLSISDYDTLFNLIGTTYGGDGQQTFNLPDLRGRVPISQGAGPGLAPRVIGQIAGVESVTLATSNLPVHEHPAMAFGGAGNQNPPTNNLLAGSSTVGLYNANEPDVELAQNSVTLAGGSRPHENLQPFLCVTYIIATVGVYPPRS
jgi:microcystin-dependent protein